MNHPDVATLGSASALEESITLQQAKKLIQCMAHEQSFLLLAPPGVGKSDMVFQAAQEAGLPCRSLLGTQIAPEDVSGIPRIIGERSVFCPPRILLPENPEPLRARRAKSLLLVAARTPAGRTRVARRYLGGGRRQSHAGSCAGARDEFGAGESRDAA